MGRREFRTSTPLRGRKFQRGWAFLSAVGRRTSLNNSSATYATNKKLCVIRPVVRNFLRGHVANIALWGGTGGLRVSAELAAWGAVSSEVVGARARLSVRVIDRSTFPDYCLCNLTIRLFCLGKDRQWRARCGKYRTDRDHPCADSVLGAESHKPPFVDCVDQYIRSVKSASEARGMTWRFSARLAPT